MEPAKLSGGILSIGTQCDSPLCLSSSRGSEDGRGIWDTVFPAQDTGQETSPAFLGGPGCSVRLVLAHLNLPPPPQTPDLETTAFIGREG